MTIDRPKGMRDKGLLSYAAANQCNRPSTSPVQYGAALYTVQYVAVRRACVADKMGFLGRSRPLVVVSSE